MILVTDALSRAARQCSIKQPTTWVAPITTEHLEMLDFLEETKDDILDRIDLPAPISAETIITGTGEERYNLPDKFRRLHRDELAVYDIALDRACVPVTNDGQWTYIKDIGTTGVIRYFRLWGYPGQWRIDLYDNPESSITIAVNYVTEFWLADASGNLKSEFTFEDDRLMLPRRVVETGVVWRFRERRGLPYQDKYNEYEALIARLSNDRRSRRRVEFGQPETKVMWQDLVPAFIPPN